MSEVKSLRKLQANNRHLNELLEECRQVSKTLEIHNRDLAQTNPSRHGDLDSLLKKLKGARRKI